MSLEAGPGCEGVSYSAKSPQPEVLQLLQLQEKLRSPLSALQSALDPYGTATLLVVSLACFALSCITAMLLICSSVLSALD